MITFRKAVESDAPFIAKSILAAERACVVSSPYERFFDLKDAEALFIQIAAEDIEGCELTFPSFIIAEEIENESVNYAGACASWIENAGGQSSGFLKAQILSYYIGADKWKEALPAMTRYNEISISRRSEFLQLDEFFVEPGFRGRGIVQGLIQFAIQLHSIAKPQFAEIIALRGNENAIKAYQKAGFTRISETFSPALEDWGGGKVLLEKKLFS